MTTIDDTTAAVLDAQATMREATQTLLTLRERVAQVELVYRQRHAGRLDDLVLVALHNARCL